MDAFTEKNDVKIIDNYDVVVVGMGVAGIAAALAAARNSSKVLIVEKSVIPGGLATLGLIAIYLPLCDGCGRKLIGGIAEELLLDSIKYGYSTLPEEWKQSSFEVKKTSNRYKTAFSPPEFVLAVEEKLRKENIDVLYDTVFSKPVMSGRRCEGIIVENKSGRTAYRCGTIVDATGDSDVFFRAGIKCAVQDNWLSYWWQETNLEAMRNAAETNDIKAGINLRMLGGGNEGDGHPEGYKKYLGIDANQVSEFIINGRKLLLDKIKSREKNSYSLLALPGMAQMRTTRRINGAYTLKEDDKFRCFEDAIGVTGDWRKPKDYYEIPFRTLISSEVDNIITAGRSISSEGDTWEVTRVIPTAAMTGEAAGTAASLAAGRGQAFQKLDVLKLQQILVKNGLIIHAD